MAGEKLDNLVSDSGAQEVEMMEGPSHNASEATENITEGAAINKS